MLPIFSLLILILSHQNQSNSGMFLEFWEPLSDKGPEAENPPSEHSTGIESHNSLRVGQIVHKIRVKKQFEI